MLRSLLWAACAQPRKQVRVIRFLKAYRQPPGAHARRNSRIKSRHAGVTTENGKDHLARWFEKEPLRHLEALTDTSMQQFIRRAKERGLALGVFSDYPALEKLKVNVPLTLAEACVYSVPLL